jgi:hypothetical protein
MFHDMFVHRTVCLFTSPDLDRYRGSLTPRDPENCKVPKPKYEAAALHEHLSIGYPNSTNGQYAQLYDTRNMQHGFSTELN